MSPASPATQATALEAPPAPAASDSVPSAPPAKCPIAWPAPLRSSPPHRCEPVQKAMSWIISAITAKNTAKKMYAATGSTLTLSNAETPPATTMLVASCTPIAAEITEAVPYKLACIWRLTLYSPPIRPLGSTFVVGLFPA